MRNLKIGNKYKHPDFGDIDCVRIFGVSDTCAVFEGADGEQYIRCSKWLTKIFGGM